MSRRYSRRRSTPASSTPVTPLFELPTWRPDRTALQLCRQVHEALSWVLGSVGGDGLLAACLVEAVEPLPTGDRLLVKVSVPADLSTSDVTSRLAGVAPKLRAAV